MHTNLDHDVFIKKGKSIALAQQVDDFLKAQGKSEPDQIPFGHSELSSKKNEYGRTAQTTMREIMFSAVRESQTAKQKTRVIDKPAEPTYSPDVSENRVLFNRHAREQAWEKGKKEFIGRCKKHGEQTFVIRKQGKDHLCCVCKKAFTKAQNDKIAKFKKGISV
ncbi:hypothetical protein [Acinetobacter sp. YH01009]|uniref:hypothetical protein n=1 Tax=Acinetobacter sp. YH01009 TaxID=2601025 RepID=UPI0015D3F77F|nr:hypothetical protein [Acinetobacter sp. YH01009]